MVLDLRLKNSRAVAMTALLFVFTEPKYRPLKNIFQKNFTARELFPNHLCYKDKLLYLHCVFMVLDLRLKNSRAVAMTALLFVLQTFSMSLLSNN